MADKPARNDGPDVSEGVGVGVDKNPRSAFGALRKSAKTRKNRPRRE